MALALRPPRRTLLRLNFMEPEPIPPVPRVIAPGDPSHHEQVQNLFIHLHLPAFCTARKLHITGTKVRFCAVLIVLATVVLAFIAIDSARGDAARTAVLMTSLGGLVSGYLAYAFGAYISGCAEHHRSSLINAILNSPHLTIKEARDVIQALENKIEAGRF